MRNPALAFWQRPRLLASIGLTVALAVLLPFASLWTRFLVGWCLGVAVYTALIVGRSLGQSRDAMRQEASRLDDSAFLISVFALVAAVASVGAVVMLVLGQSASTSGRAWDLALAAATMICTWVFVQIVFTVHYAHLYMATAAAARAAAGSTSTATPSRISSIFCTSP